MRILDAWPFLADPFMIVLRSIHGYFLEKGGGREDIFISSLQVVSSVEKKFYWQYYLNFASMQYFLCLYGYHPINFFQIFMICMFPYRQYLFSYNLQSTYNKQVDIPIVQVHNTYQNVFLFRIKSKKPLENHRYHPQRVSVNCKLGKLHWLQQNLHVIMLGAF